MATKTGIEWTDSTWNPIRGCSRVSEGCRNCYAERTAAFRLAGGGRPYEGLAVLKNGEPHWTGKIMFVEQRLLDPLKWKAPRRIFVNSMSDLFHENVTDEMRDKIFAVMALCPQHTFQVLTKRPENMLRWFTKHHNVRHPGAREMVYGLVQQHPGYSSTDSKWMTKAMRAFDVWPLPNVWLGVSVENEKAADERIESLLRTPAAVRFISAEPLLGPLNLGWVGCECDEPDSWDGVIDALRGKTWIEEWDNADGSERRRVDCQTVPKIDWVICGGESGPGARPMHPDWARSVRDQCVAAGVPFFFKQWGEYASASEVAGAGAHVHFPDGATVRRVGKHNAGSLLDGMEWKQFPETPRLV